MQSIYDFTDYRGYLEVWLERGFKSKMAQAIGVSSTLISLILKGEKQLSMDQALEVTEFLHLNEKETDYFLLMVEFGRAGTHKLQQRLLKNLKQAQASARKVSHRVRKDVALSDEVKAIFYSDWIYSGIRNLSAVPGYDNVPALASRLSLPPARVAKAVDFLLENGLCRLQDGRITYGPAHTHLDADSPFVQRHHQNWRIKGFQNMDHAHSEQQLFFTCPLSCSKEVVGKIRGLLPNLIEEVMKLAAPSPSEETYCLNIDWFHF